MSAINPPIDYYSDESKHGSYVYETLENLVNNFMSNYTGDGEILGPVKRSKVIYHMKKGIQGLTFNALREVKAVELSLNDTLDIILPPDYVNYVRISYVNETTGQLHKLSENSELVQATSYLQDNDGAILFDEDGFILEGTTLHSEINDSGVPGNITERRFCGSGETNWGLDPTINANGTFNINTRLGKIHFSSDNAFRVVMLEYISDGLEFSNESDIKINKMAEQALYQWTNWQLLNNKLNVQEYIIARAKKNYDTAFRNAKIALTNLKVNDVIHWLGSRKQWLK